MYDKEQILAALKDEFDRWEELVAGLSEEQITAPRLPADLSVKDVLAHLMAWQQVSIARLEAAELNHAPAMPDWVQGLDPDADDADGLNARIHAAYLEQPWARVHQEWRNGFQRFLKLGGEIPETELTDAVKYPWLKGSSLMSVLTGSYEHHHVEHLEPLLAWLHPPDA